MPSPIALTLLLAIAFALCLLARSVVRGLARQQRPAGAAADIPPARPEAGGVLAFHPCPACGGVGFTLRAEPALETRMEPQTEFYTDQFGRPASRTITRPRTVTVTKTVHAPCGFCGGSGRSRS